MNIVSQSRQKGFAIADALIAFGVMVIAGVALLSLQGTLMNSSGLSKARAEATVIARDHMELWRNYVEDAQYLAGPSPSKPINPTKVEGVNAEFMVRYDNMPGSADAAEQLTVSVCWECDVDADGVLTADDEKSVSLETMIYYSKPEIASAVGAQHDSSDSDPPNFPSPWITGEEGPHDSTKAIKEADLSGGRHASDYLELIEEVDAVTGVITKTDTKEIEVITYFDPATGHSNVEVVHGLLPDDNDNLTIPHVRLTSFGGVVHKIKGEIILHHDADTKLTQIIDNFKLLASPPSYCVAPICAGGNCRILSCDDVSDGTSLCNNEISTGEFVQYVSYVCYVPGDCTNQDEYADLNGNGTVDADEIGRLEGCQAGFKPPLDKNLNGGWYGRIGNFNLFLNKEKDMICTADTSVMDKHLTPSREYTSHRWELDGAKQFIAGNEGFNRPFDCNPENDTDDKNAFIQTFIIAGKASKATACLDDIASKYRGLVLPPSQVVRIVGQSGAIPGTVVPTDPNAPTNSYPVPRDPKDPTLTHLVEPFTDKTVVLPAFRDYCVPAP